MATLYEWSTENETLTAWAGVSFLLKRLEEFVNKSHELFTLPRLDARFEDGGLAIRIVAFPSCRAMISFDMRKMEFRIRGYGPNGSSGSRFIPCKRVDGKLAHAADKEGRLALFEELNRLTAEILDELVKEYAP